MKDYSLFYYSIIPILTFCLGIGIAAVAASFFYRRIIKEKDKGLIKHIKNEEELASELAKAQIEKEMLEKMLEKQLTINN